MSVTAIQYARAGILTFLTFLLLLSFIGVFLFSLLGFPLALGYGGFIEALKLLPAFFSIAIERLMIFGTHTVSIPLLATYFGVRAAYSGWFGWIETAIASLLIPSLVMFVLGGKIDQGDTTAGLVASLFSVLLCRYFLVKFGVLKRLAATP